MRRNVRLQSEEGLYQLKCMKQRVSSSEESLSFKDLIHRVVDVTPVLDIHTHLYDPKFGPRLLWGIDELLTYHYLVAESFRVHRMSFEKFWMMKKSEQADLIWKLLFIDNSPLSEACRGVLTVLNRLGLDVKARDLPALRKYFKTWTPERYVGHMMELANVERLLMTNNPFDEIERPLWMKGWRRDERFEAVLRLDDILISWPQRGVPVLREWGYDVSEDVNQRTLDEVRRYLHEWIVRMNPSYLAVSLPPDFSFPDPYRPAHDQFRSRLISDAVLPECREHGLPFAMMIGVKKQVNPGLGDAGDSLGKADVGVVERMCATWPENKFLVTMLSRENQHELCVAARKFHNLHIFGCWWFLNNPSVIEEMTRERLELLGLSMTPQHSDCRVLDQLVYKWDHFRTILKKVLTDKYADLIQTGWEISEEELRRDVRNLLGGSFRQFLKS